MANENEDIKNDSASTEGENKEAHESKHQTWVGKIVEKIEDVIENMDTDFPLSGGEEHPVHHKHHTEEEETEEDKKEEHHKKSSFLHDLDTEFPLSGGEV